MMKKISEPVELLPFQQRLEDLCCVNSVCPDRGIKNKGNLIIRNGKGTKVWRILRCNTCKTEFSERKGTAMFNSHLSTEKFIAIAEHLKEGCGIRSISRLLKVSKKTVSAVVLRSGIHARALHEEKADKLDVKEVQFDEKWSFVNKKEKHCDANNLEDDSRGDQWDFTAIDSESRFVVSCVVGKRTSENVKHVVSDFGNRTGNKPPALITTDALAAYKDVLMDRYGEKRVPKRTGNRGRPRKEYKTWPKGSVYAIVKKSYKQGRVSKVTRGIVYGTQDDLLAALKKSKVSKSINTAFVERQNGTDRAYNKRKIRHTLSFSKLLIMHIAATLWIFYCYNFVQLNRGLEKVLDDRSILHRTPAMALGIVSKPCSVQEVLFTQVVGIPNSSRVDLNFFKFWKRIGRPAP